MGEQHPAYTGRLIVSFGAEGELFRPPEPGAVTDADDAALARLRRLAVDPVVASLLAEDELESLSLHRDIDDPHVIWVQLIARGERFFDTVTDPSWAEHADGSPRVIAARLADHLADWVCETRFAWGEQRTASYSLPTDTT